jgi:hypothetical protein
MGKHDWIPPKANDGVEGYLFAHRVVKASRQFLQANPEGGKSFPTFHQIMAGADHLTQYPGDIPLFEGKPAPKGKYGKK